ncbi:MULTISPECIES: purine/pyrimidine permease [unclassified Exiguobacterium]|uniref:purine/pyrimidine permease n=1 Tax=unclassified Exiguobacterium TaxID=2644629 RepID=UPI001BE6C4F1|nr:MULTISPECIES: purine/pyrimidine permease [unclassified Exiguobacterium]
MTRSNVTTTIQWFIFILATNIVPPLSIAALFELSPDETMTFISRSLFIFALFSIVQTLLGHRLPILEGPAGIWWGVFTLYASIGPALYGSQQETLQALGFMLFLSGILGVLLTVTGILRRMLSLFTPQVLGVYMILLVLQLSGAVIKGGFGVTEDGINIVQAVATAGLVLFALTLEQSRFKQYGLVMTLFVGFGLFHLLDLGNPIVRSESFFLVPELLPFGNWVWDWNLLPTAFVITLLLMTNVLANIKLIERIVSSREKREVKGNVPASGVASGISQIVAGLFGTPGPVAISGTAGFLSSTESVQRAPHLIAHTLMMGLALIGPFVSLIASIPAAVGYAIVTPLIATMIIIGINEAAFELKQSTASLTVGLPLVIGAGAMLLPPGSMNDLPPLLATVFSNGLVLGTIVALTTAILSKIKD